MNETIQQALSLLAEGESQAAYDLLQPLVAEQEANGELHYYYACACDHLGHVHEAIPHYEHALALGLSEKDRLACLTQFGSSYRAIGEYQRAIAIFDQGLEEFPEDHGLLVFRAITLYNLNFTHESTSILVRLLAETSTSPTIRKYSQALDFYSANLDSSW